MRSFLLPYKKLLVAVFAFQFVAVAATMTLPTLNAMLIDQGILKGNTNYILKIGVVMLVLSLVQAVFGISATWFGSRAGMGFGRDIRDRLFHTVTGFSTREVDSFGAPSLIIRITNDVQQVQTLVVMLCTSFISAPITIVVGVYLAVREDGPLSLILVASIPVLLLSIGTIVIRVIPQYRDMQERIDKMSQVLREQIVGMRVVRAFVREPLETQRFDEANQRLTRTATLTSRYMSSMFPTVMLVLNVSSAAAVWVAANRIGAGDMQIGALIAFLTYLVQILMAVMMATFVAVMWPRASVCAERINEVLDTDSSIITSPTPVTQLSGKGTLEFRNVGFCYPGAEIPVLSNVSFTTRPGQTTAIIGSTGSGKTTLVNLVARLTDSTEGSILIDDVDVRDLEPETLWKRVSVVPQRPYLFSGTIRSNLLFADPEASEADLWKALEIAQAADFVNAMTDKLDSPISQGGTNVSGGQRQRLAIARSLVRKPGIYVFDDSFSALDLATDARLRTALAPVTSDAALIIVAQRVSTIKHADQILVLDNGECVGVGTHHELLANCPTYAEIVESQMTAEEAA
ncbi:MAG: ATP-binding cassette domain-containing protein [Actinobacteria bacterium]|nr:ATP-binding cassette domain-containing protein [Actinomycetota bacterium]